MFTIHSLIHSFNEYLWVFIVSSEVYSYDKIKSLLLYTFQLVGESDDRQGNVLIKKSQYEEWYA